MAAAAGVADAERASDPGYHLIAEGRPALERRIGFRPSLRLWVSRFNMRLGIGGYIGAILLVTTMLLALALWTLSIPGIDVGWLALFALISFLPATEVATALFDREITWSSGAMNLPVLEHKASGPHYLQNGR